MTSWKTSLAGILSAVGVAMRQGPPSVAVWSDVVTAIGVAVIGFTARDHDKTSEDVGLKPKPPAPPPTES